MRATMRLVMQRGGLCLLCLMLFVARVSCVNADCGNCQMDSQEITLNLSGHVISSLERCWQMHSCLLYRLVFQRTSLLIGVPARQSLKNTHLSKLHSVQRSVQRTLLPHSLNRNSSDCPVPYPQRASATVLCMRAPPIGTFLLKHLHRSVVSDAVKTFICNAFVGNVCMI
jgi:hypothetical protein